MDKRTGSGDSQDTELQIWPQEVCRFAYTLNNEQPVRCTWISDQPLFYSDYDEAIDDDSLFDDPILQALERDIADLRQKTTAYDKIAQEFAHGEEEKLSLFREDAAFISVPLSQKEDQLQTLLTVAHESRLASQYLSFAQINGIEIKLSNQVLDASYDRGTHTILVRADLDQADQILLLTRELRRMYQHKNGAGLHPLALHPDYAVVVNRAQVADLSVHMIRVAWELHLAGQKSVWARLENSPMSDLGRAFAREAIADFRSIGNGLAIRATFESWFLSERCRKADRVLIQQMLADYQGYSFSDNPEASRLIALDMMKALGKVPFGQNYLDFVAGQMLLDPVFTDVRDRSNANFLWFIKFERSFTEAEKDMTAEEAGRPSAQILSFPAAGKGKKSGVGELSGVAEIVDLYRYGRD
ncbi:MAG TPA: hypothetical protein PKH37_00340 [Alphaproteobacteria bacterium]|nr:hypothetical protein [Alphaproteobacteria bacterium]